MESENPNPVRVRLAGLGELCPPDLSSTDRRAWLTAPIAGEPLYKRVLQVLLPLRITELVLEPGATSETVLELFEERPIYNLKARMAQNPLATSPDDAGTIVLPIGGFLEADLGGLVMRGQSGDRVERTPVNVAGPDATRRAEIVYLPPGHSVAEFAPDSSPSDDYLPAPPILRPTDTSVGLRELAQRALEGDLATIHPVGTWRGDQLLGDDADVSTGIRTIGKVAVGNGSSVAAGSVLGPGAIIGEDCQVEAGAHLTHAMVLDGARVEAGARLLGGIYLPSGELL